MVVQAGLVVVDDDYDAVTIGEISRHHKCYHRCY